MGLLQDLIARNKAARSRATIAQEFDPASGAPIVPLQNQLNPSGPGPAPTLLQDSRTAGPAGSVIGRASEGARNLFGRFSNIAGQGTSHDRLQESSGDLAQNFLTGLAVEGAGGRDSVGGRAFYDVAVPLTIANEQAKAEEEARAATEGRFEEARHLIGLGRIGDQRRTRESRDEFLGELGENRESAQTDLQSLREEVLGRLGDNASTDTQEAQRLADQVNRTFSDREAGIMGMLEGFGDQQRADLDQSFDEELARQNAALSSRGLGSSTLLSNVGTGVARERGSARNRLEDFLTSQQVNAATGLSRDRADALERTGSSVFNVGAAGRAGISDAASQFGADAFNLNRGFDESSLQAGDRFRNQIATQAAGSRGDLISLIGARDDVAPSQNAFLSTMAGLGRFGAGTPEAPGTAEGLAGPAIGAAGSALTMKIMMAVCVDAAEPIETDQGPKQLGDIQLGDMVLGDDGEFHPVINMDVGGTHKQRANDFVLVSYSDSNGHHRAVRLTFDHLVNKLSPNGDVDGDDWVETTVLPIELESGDYLDFEKVVIGVSRIEAPVRSGDLELEDCDGYRVNGLLVHSMIKNVLQSRT